MTVAQTTLPQDRHRALAELDAEIEHAERTCIRCRLDVRDMMTPQAAGLKAVPLGGLNRLPRRSRPPGHW
jgi:hypothetical protein